MAKVSIIVPVYNVEKYLPKCLDSLVNQTFKDIEIVIINDGTKDNSQEIIDEYVKKYPKIVKSYIKENGGLGSARNYGIMKAIADYIVFVDSDDFVEPNMIEKLYNKITNDKSDICIFASNVVDEEYKLIESKYINIIDKCENNLKYILYSNICAWNKIYKKSIIIDNKLEFRSKIWYEDVDFTIKVLSLSKKVSIINEPFYNYLLRSGSIMNNTNIDKNLDILLSFDEAIKYLKDKKIYDKYYSEIEFLAIYHIYITGITRIINIKTKMDLKLTTINKLISFMEEEFPNFKDNKYITCLNKRHKLVYNLLNKKMYRTIRFMFKLKGK